MIRSLPGGETADVMEKQMEIWVIMELFWIFHSSCPQLPSSGAFTGTPTAPPYHVPGAVVAWCAGGKM